MDIDIRELSIKEIGLSKRATNALLRAGFETVGDIMHLDEYALLQLPALGANSAREILQRIDALINNAEKDYGSDNPSFLYESIDFRLNPKYKESILEYVRKKDLTIQELGLRGRPLNQLLNNGLANLSDIIFMTREDLAALPAMGAQSVNKVLECINQFATDNEELIKALHEGDLSVLWNDDLIKKKILDLYAEEGFKGLSLTAIIDKLDLPEDYPKENIKTLIGQLIADRELEYVDFRVYRIYHSFEDYISRVSTKNDRNKSMVIRRLNGETLAEIGDDYNLTRERVRQIINKTYKEVKNTYLAETGLKWFDEEYYTYFYKTYAFDKNDGSQWFNISPATWRYLDLLDIKQGSKDLEEAVDDAEIDAGLRLKIKNYVNRNKVLIDGIWVEKKRAELEEAAVKMCCRENTTFDDFCGIYNSFLEDYKVEYNEKLYMTDAVKPTRRNHLPNSRYLLWKQNETIRYYDIDGRDYSELLDELNLDSFEDVEISTYKLMTDHMDIMKRYDIRDQYELHNLLRKIVPEGSYHDFKCGRMPMILFGSFDRDAVIEEMVIENAPIEVEELANLIHEEYGYDQATIMGTYLRCVYKYLKNGIYTRDYIEMSPENRAVLKSALTEDFYYISEVKEIYKNVAPKGNPEDISSYNLRSMGFLVLSNCILQNHSSLEEFLDRIFAETEIIDLKIMKARYGLVAGFYRKMMELKRDLTIIEFEPDKAINFNKLESAGVSKEQIHGYCDKVYDFVGSGSYFSANSIRQAGFTHELYDLGFSDWFYANLLLSDDRFSFTHIYGNIVLFTGSESITIVTFITQIIQKYGSVDMYDLISKLENVYGCSVVDRYDIVYRLKGTQVFYDNILDRLYASSDLYERELELAEGF